MSLLGIVTYHPSVQLVERCQPIEGSAELKTAVEMQPAGIGNADYRNMTTDVHLPELE